MCAKFDIEAARKYHRQHEARQRSRRESERQKWLDLASQAVREIAAQHPDIARVFLFGSLTQPGRFHERSDIDVAVEADTIKSERPFWQALEQALRRDVDLRTLAPPIARAVEYWYMNGQQIFLVNSIREDMKAIDEIYAKLERNTQDPTWQESSTVEETLIVQAYIYTEQLSNFIQFVEELA